MATFLELVRDVCNESGAIPGGATLQTVTGATGRVAKAIAWTRDAWRDIQSERHDWLWMQDQFLGATLPGIRGYNAAGMGLDPARHAAWGLERDRNGKLIGFSTYRADETVASEGILPCLEWLEFRRRCLVGAPSLETGAPALISIGPDNRIWVYPLPDAAHRIRGDYRKAPQTLSADADVPEMPAHHHRLIIWRALILMGIHDEATQQDPAWRLNADTRMTALVNEQTSRSSWGGPLA